MTSTYFHSQKNEKIKDRGKCKTITESSKW